MQGEKKRYEKYAYQCIYKCLGIGSINEMSHLQYGNKHNENHNLTNHKATILNGWSVLKIDVDDNAATF